MLELLEDLAKETAKEDDKILMLVDPFLRPVVAKRKIAFMREVSLAAGWHDPTFLIGLAFGLPALGWACRAPTMQVRWAPPEIPISDLWVDLESHNANIVKNTRQSTDRDLDFAAWGKSMTEVKNDFIIGPYRHLDEIPGSRVRLLRRFGTWEQHGGAVEPTCRLIDDALAGGQNRASGSQHTHRPTDLDAWIAQVRVVKELYPNEPIEQFASDFASAYKQVPGDPALANLAVITQWSPIVKKPVFFVGRTQFFGGQKLPSELRSGSGLGVPPDGQSLRDAAFALCRRHAGGRPEIDNLSGLLGVEGLGATSWLGRTGPEEPAAFSLRPGVGGDLRPLPNPPCTTPHQSDP